MVLHVEAFYVQLLRWHQRGSFSVEVSGLLANSAAFLAFLRIPPTLRSLFPFARLIILGSNSLYAKVSIFYRGTFDLSLLVSVGTVLLDPWIAQRDDGKVSDERWSLLWRARPEAGGRLFDLVKKSPSQNTHHGQVRVEVCWRCTLCPLANLMVDRAALNR